VEQPNAEAKVLQILYGPAFNSAPGAEWSRGGINNKPAIGYRLQIVKHPTRAGEVLTCPLRDDEDPYDPDYKVGEVGLIYVPLIG